MAVGDAGSFYPIRPPAPGDSVIQVGEDAWALALDFPLLPTDSMSADAIQSLLTAFSRFVVGAFSALPETVAVQLVVVQRPLLLSSVTARYQAAARELMVTSPGASNVAWIWANYLQSLQTQALSTRRGAVVLTARKPSPTVRERVGGLLRRKERGQAINLGQEEAQRLLREATRQVLDAGHDVGFGLSPLGGDDLAALISLWTRGEVLPATGTADRA